jgi:hypothetical protein
LVRQASPILLIFAIHHLLDYSFSGLIPVKY